MRVKTIRFCTPFASGSWSSTISVPVARTCSGVIPLIVACVPTGMNAGVSTVPCGVLSRPRRAAVA